MAFERFCKDLVLKAFIQTAKLEPMPEINASMFLNLEVDRIGSMNPTTKYFDLA